MTKAHEVLLGRLNEWLTHKSDCDLELMGIDSPRCTCGRDEIERDAAAALAEPGPTLEEFEAQVATLTDAAIQRIREVAIQRSVKIALATQEAVTWPQEAR